MSTVLSYAHLPCLDPVVVYDRLRPGGRPCAIHNALGVVHIAPNWLAEILSPSTQQIDRTSKMQIYADYGVGHLWYVDPVVHTLEVFALSNSKYTLMATFKDDDAVAAPPFETHTFDLASLWPDDM